MFKKWGGILKSHLVSGSKVKSSVGHGTLNLHDKRVFPEGGVNHNQSLSGVNQAALILSCCLDIDWE